MVKYKKETVTIAEQRNVWETVTCDTCGKLIYSKACIIPGLQVKKSRKKQPEQPEEKQKAEKQRKVKFFTSASDIIDYYYEPDETTEHFCSKECAMQGFDRFVRSVWHRCNDREYFAIRLSEVYVTEVET